MHYPILYSFRRCPYAMRARLAVLVSGQTCEIREIVLRAKPEAMLLASPKGTVPVMVLPNGQIIDESLEIMHWALARHDPEGWLDGADAALIAQNDGAFKHHLDRYKYPDRFGEDPLDHRAAGLSILSEWDMRLRAGGNMCGAKRGLADMAIMPFVRQFAATDKAWLAAQDLPHLRDWLERLMQSALFARAMVRLRPWQPGDAPLYFGGAACLTQTAP